MNPELYEYRDSTQRYFSAVFIRDFMKRHNVTLEEVKEMFDTIYGDKHDESN